MDNAEIKLPLKVFCHHCKEHIYNLLVIPEYGGCCAAEMFECLDESTPKPLRDEYMICPKCNKLFVEINEWGQYRVLTEYGYLPRVED